MARQRKVIRSKRIYKKHRFPKKAVGAVLFVLLILALVGVGYAVMQEISKRSASRDEEKDSSMISSEPISSDISSEISSDTSSDTPPRVSNSFSKTAFASGDDIIANAASLDSYFEAIKQAGYSSVAVELKPVSGMLTFKTENAFAKVNGTIQEGTPELSAIYNSIIKAGLKPIAAMSTLKDQKAAHVSRDNSYAYGDSLSVNWLDNSVALGGKAWLNPYMENARNYLTELAVEINGAGFDTIILENVMFPDKFTDKMNTIETTPEREVILGQLVSEIEKALPTANVYVSVDMAQVASNGLAYINAISDKIVPKFVSEQLNAMGTALNITDGDAVAIARAMLDGVKVNADGIIMVSQDDYSVFESVIGDNYVIYN